jgi:superfamily I DNA and/or RNA helicase
LKRLLADYTEHRFLVSAPTHNAVDNLMQRFIQEDGAKAASQAPLRVSTDVGKVASALKPFTCDALVGKDLSAGFAGRGEAQKRVKASRIIFTTCTGAGLGLLRTEDFGVVIVDEASQITEPGTLVPLAKGCKRAVLVGDHVQLRATVQRSAVLTSFDMSLFERLYTAPDRKGVAKVMLDTQYRMHPDLCAFSSNTFYEGKLQTATNLDRLAIPQSQFPWPLSCRKIFVPCTDTEDIGRVSKSNQGQVRLCKRICQLLNAVPRKTNDGPMVQSKKADIAILTPYTRQRQLLETSLKDHTVSSIDGFQGREAEIVIFVTVRSNAHHEIGFLSDMRRLNVVMTRAKAGVVIIGHRDTLVQQGNETGDQESKRIWRELLVSCEKVEIEGEPPETK